MTTTKRTPYRAVRGLRYPTNPAAKRENWQMKRVQPGEVVDDIPARSVAWLLQRGYIAPVGDEIESGQEGDDGTPRQ